MIHPMITALQSDHIAYQGEAGANSHLACEALFPDAQHLACATFEDCFTTIEQGRADLAVIPIENSVAGRVADIHHLLPTSQLQIIGEYFMPIQHQLLGIHGANLSEITHIHSHVMALGQCRRFIQNHGLKPCAQADTAGSARLIAEQANPYHTAIASILAAQIYDLEILQENIEDEGHNTTRFIILAKNAISFGTSDEENELFITSFIFKMRNVPAALYKGLGGFATNGVNMTKLESYQINGQFFATQFYAEIEGHPQDQSVILAMEELAFFSEDIKILGTYPASPFRRQKNPA